MEEDVAGVRRELYKQEQATCASCETPLLPGQARLVPSDLLGRSDGAQSEICPVCYAELEQGELLPPDFVEE